MAKILLVEDDHMTNELIAEYLSDAGHTILSAFNGADAFKYFQQGGMELVILDIMLPGLNGLQVLKEIRRTSNVPVLMLTALNDEKTQINSFDALAPGVGRTERAYRGRPHHAGNQPGCDGH